MAEVPYQPFPDVAPPERILRPGGVPEIPDAFGVGVARAVDAFGGKFEDAGQKVFETSLALRRLDMDNKVRDQITSTYARFAPTREKFMSATGVNASVDKLTEFHGQLDDAYQVGLAQARALGPYAEKKYGDEAASWYRQVSNAATEHSANETKAATRLSIKNSDAMSSDLVSSAPGNERAYQEQVAAALDRKEREGALEGYTRDEIDFNKKNAVSGLASDRVTAAALADKNGTGAAYDLLQRLQQEKVPGQDYAHLNNQKDIQDAEKVVRQRFFAGSDASIASRTQDLLDEVRTFGTADTPRAKRLASEIDGLRQRRVALGETQEVSDLAGKELQGQIGAAQTEFKVNAELRGSSLYQPMIDAAAARHGYNPIILARQLDKESRLDPNVPASPKGAQGIAQFMPATAKQYGVDVRSPSSSIEGAAHMMEDMLRGQGGNLGLALAAYNWGSGNLAEWKAAGANPRSMPEETLNYIKDITGQSIGDWLAGKRPDMTALAAPPAAAGGVQRALAIVNDPSLTSGQRDAGVKAIKGWRETNITLAHQAEEKQKQVDDNFRTNVMQDSSSERPQITTKMIEQMPGGEGQPSASAKEAAIRWINRIGMPDVVSVPESKTNTSNLYKRIIAPEGNPQRITTVRPIDDAYIDGSITREQHDWLEKKLNDPMTPGGERLSRVRSELSTKVSAILDKSILGYIDQNGKLQSYRWERDLDDAIDQYRKDKKDPMDLLDPRKSDFFASDKKLQDYQIPLEQSIKNLQNRITGGGALPAPTSPTVTAAPGVPGVTPAFGKPAPSPQAPAAPRALPEETSAGGAGVMEYLKRTAPMVMAPGQL